MEDLSRRWSAVSVVLDNSATLARIFGDETTEPIRRVFDAVGQQGAFVPSIWRLEIANSLTAAMRRRRIDHEFRRAALADLGELDIIVHGLTDTRARNATLDLCDRFRLTAYDAAYRARAAPSLAVGDARPGYAKRRGSARTATSSAPIEGALGGPYAHPCSAVPTNSRRPASRLERKSLSAVAASAPATFETCQARRPA
jgi:predicted nucleic acid-binding protein